MSEFKGTGGKWKWIKFTDTRLPRLVNDSDELVLGLGDSEPYYPSEGYEPDDYDALIISKAPEMLDMLKKVCTELYSLDNSMATEVKKLIEEATDVDA